MTLANGVEHRPPGGSILEHRPEGQQQKQQNNKQQTPARASGGPADDHANRVGAQNDNYSGQGGGGVNIPTANNTRPFVRVSDHKMTPGCCQHLRYHGAV